MCSKRHSPPSLLKLLLVVAHILVAISNISLAASVSNGHPDQQANAHLENASIEERIVPLVKSAVQTLTYYAKVTPMRLFPFKLRYVDNLIRNKIGLFPGLFQTPAFVEVAQKVIEMHLSLTGAMTSLFNGLMRAEKAVGRPGINLVEVELVHEILRFMSRPDWRLRQSSIFGRSRAPKTVDDPEWLRWIVEGLEPPLLQWWKSQKLEPNVIQNKLGIHVDIRSFFKDIRVKLWVDYIAEYANSNRGGPSDCALIVLRQHYDDISIATSLVAAGAVTEPNSFAGSVMQAMLREWTIKQKQPEILLHELVPSLEGILKSPLKIWIEYAEPILETSLYSTMVRTLVQPHLVLSGMQDDLALQLANELALVDIIVAEWSKETGKYSRKTLLSHIFLGLCQLWKERNMSPTEVWEFLGIEKAENSIKQTPRLRAWTEFVVNTVRREDLFAVLDSMLSDFEMSVVLARLLDGEVMLYSRISVPLYDRWRDMKKTSKQVFEELKLLSPGEDLFKNRLLGVWYYYEPDSRATRQEHILRKRELLKSEYKGEDFERDLQRSTLISDGELQRCLSILWTRNSYGMLI